jgi:hypothetical protein
MTQPAAVSAHTTLPVARLKTDRCHWRLVINGGILTVVTHADSLLSRRNSPW